MYDVIVIGAGIAGLAAGHTLQAAGCQVLVLEARQRIGGESGLIRAMGRSSLAPSLFMVIAQLPGS